MSEILKIKVEDGVAVLTMNRPEKRNAMCDELLDEDSTWIETVPEEMTGVISVS